MNSPAADRVPDPDTALLEGLFRLTFAGATQGGEFERLSAEVYARLACAYAAPAVGSAQVMLRGQEPA
ncbi:hypothetical protein HH299_10610 [Xanthomonas sp. Kuri4-2]